MKQNCYLYKTSHISRSKKKSSSVWQHNSCLLVNTGNYFISSTLGHFATFDMCWHFFSILDYNFPSTLLFLTPPILVAPTCTQTRNYDRDVGTQSLGPQCVFPSSLVVPGPPQEELRRRGREAYGSWGIGRLPPGLPQASLPWWVPQASPPCSGQTPPQPPWWRARVRGIAGWALHVQSPTPTYSWVSFLAPGFGSTTEGLQPCNSFCLCWFAEPLLGIFSSTKERSTFNFKACAACIFCPSDLDLACSEINQYNI